MTAPAPIGADYKDSPFAGELSPESVQKSRDLAALYEAMAERHGCLFVNADRAEVSADCEHLSPKGHEQLAGLICRAIKEG